MNGIDYTAAREIGYTHGSTAAYVARLMLEGGESQAREWAEQAPGAYSRRGRHELVELVSAKLAA
ncbi:hypothetical protein ACIQZO_22850 [Streptomyces sp. NPDC097617]|uniref:hypothetical protein n=1 Tax=Streptomyces sp. NPDC097617 TaxID=3366091 RepID=UPI0038094CDC